MTAPPNRGREKIRQALRRVFLKQSLVTTPEPRAMPEGTGLRPCPQCGAREWQFGLVDIQCTSCGYRYRPTAAEMPRDDRGQRGCAVLGPDQRR
jgi:hypothetical protein